MRFTAGTIKAKGVRVRDRVQIAIRFPPSTFKQLKRSAIKQRRTIQSQVLVFVLEGLTNDTH